MIIPDQSHINRVRDALWQFPQGCASVMVGAGFSRNARKAGTDAREFPLWNDVAGSLCKKLYSPGDGHRLKSAIAEASGTSGFLRLAQEYQAAFGRGPLHQFIQELVPDEDYAPGDMHIRLLRLPWRDVFTTNWDTLLERSRSLVADRAYGIVRTCEEIPSATKPRIIKLHGSFPAHIPFIFTEEDYRTYPKRFAPFVNTVQQAMMETVFCLVGFSGDDPNFLHWSGWVRDNLGELAPKIYLAGWLDLSPHRRRMLEERNVVPIDVARHPQAMSWPDHLRHTYATEWILQTLERGRPYQVRDWPLPSHSARRPIPELLKPIEEVAVDAPVDGPDIRGAKPEELPKVVAQVIKALEHNRKVYPGWLFIPPSKHPLLDRKRQEWEKAILEVLPGYTPVEKLTALRELIWLRNKLLESLTEDLELVVQAVLSEIDCTSRKIVGRDDPNLNWPTIREAWRELAMALLTGARQRFQQEKFQTYLADLKPFMDDHPDVVQHVLYEKCLSALYNLDFATLDGFLKEWQPRGTDPIWMSRKAAILVEMDRDEEAIALLNDSLSIIRETPRHSRSLAGPSREGWALWLALAFERELSGAVTKVVEAPPAFKRWEQLATLQCDAFAQKNDLMTVIHGKGQIKEAPTFDLGTRRGRTITYSSAKLKQLVGARRAVRLAEVAALPPSASHMVVMSDLLGLAAETLADKDFRLSSRLVLRFTTSEDDSVFEFVWARTRIAAMPMEDVEGLVAVVRTLIKYALPRAVREKSIPWVTRLRIGIEALSRLVLRLSPERAEEVFKEGLQYYRMDTIAKDPWLSKPMQHLLSRSWEALPKTNRNGLILEIFTAPIAGLDGFTPIVGYYPEPAELVGYTDDISAPERSPETESQWSQVAQLIIRGLRARGEARKRSSLRLVSVSLWGRLTDDEKASVAEALWSEGNIRADELPTGLAVYDWTLLLLPELEPGQAEQRVRRKWFEMADNNKSDFLWELGTGLVALRQLGRPVALTAEEDAKVHEVLSQWVAVPEPWDKTFTSKGIKGIESLLRVTPISAELAQSLFEKTVRLNQTEYPAFRLFPSLVKYLPEKVDEVGMSMRIGLASDKVETAEEALLALHSWMTSATEDNSGIPVPPVDLLREVGLMIASRRKGVLNFALQVGRWIFVSGSTDQRNAVAQSIFHGLAYLLEELRYDRPHGRERAAEIPVLRWGCAHLALAMSAAGYHEDPTVMRWAEVVAQDPLPEVRYAEIPASARKGEGAAAVD